MFDLDKSIAVWRCRYEHDRAFLPEDLRELERHVRDAVAAQVERGRGQEEAFLAVLREMGEDEEVRIAYRTVRWGKLKRQHILSHHLGAEIAMVKNYCKTALRNLLRHKGYALIHILGLALAISAGVLILRYVSFELSYDRFHRHADDLYRLTNDRYQNGVLIQHGVLTYPSVPKALKAEYPEVLDYVRISPLPRRHVRVGEVGFDESGMVFADSAFLGMFTFPLVQGDPRTALDEPYSILFSETTAAKYFGADWRQKSVLGRRVTMDNQTELTVAGVFQDVPPNSHMRFDILVSYSTLTALWGPEIEDSWINSNFRVYLRLVPGTDPTALERKLVQFSARHFKGAEVTGSIEAFFLQPLKDVHLYSDYEYEAWAHGNGTSVWAMLVAAGFVLLIAWLNYINLSAARALERAKEVGVRKVVGAGRAQLIRQFLVEAALLNGVGLLAGLLLATVLRPILANALGVTLPGSLPAGAALGFAGLLTLGMLASGTYPALMLSAFKPVSVLRGTFTQLRGRRLWKSLVVVQFALSFAIIAGTFTVHRQVRYMQDQDLGMNIEQVLALQGPRLTPWDSTYFTSIGTFKAAVLGIPGVRHATAAQRVPGTRTGRIFEVQRVDGPTDTKHTTAEIGVDHDFFETFGMKVLAGRGFTAADHAFEYEAIRSIVLNESAARLVGFASPERAVHERLRFWEKEWEVVGVVADHHQESLKVPTEATVFLPIYSTGNTFFLKVSPQGLSSTITAVKQQYLTLFPGNTFDYYFLDDAFNEQYEGDLRFRNLFGLFSALGVVLACMGLFGLSLLTTARRTKEIGIRKVLGASVSSILSLLARDFLKLVGVATLAACPLTYLAAERWLATYAYHLEVGWLLFALPAVALLLIALATVSYQAVRAALADPVKSLRYE